MKLLTKGQNHFFFLISVGILDVGPPGVIIATASLSTLAEFFGGASLWSKASILISDSYNNSLSRTSAGS